MSRPAIWLTAITIALSPVVPACAATMQMTFSGLLSGGFDTSGLFGTAQGDLAGAAYVLSFIYDTGKGFHDLSVPLFETLSGGSSTGFQPGPVSATLQVNGIGVALSGAYRGYVSSCDASVCGSAEITADVTDLTISPNTGAVWQTYVSQSLVDAGAACAITGHLVTPAGCAVTGETASATLPGFFQIYRDDGQTVIENTYGYMLPDRFSVTLLDMAPVPLPLPALTLLAALSALAAITRTGRAFRRARGVIAG